MDKYWRGTVFIYRFKTRAQHLIRLAKYLNLDENNSNFNKTEKLVKVSLKRYEFEFL